MLIKTFIAAAALALACAAAFSATLENGCFRLAIDDAGRLTELYNKKTATQYCHGKGEMPVAVFAMESPAPRPIPLVCDKTEETENGIVCEYSGGEAKVTLTVSEDKSRPEIVLWDAKVRNEGAQRITEIQCPRVSGLRIGSRAYDDTLVRPNRYGEKIPYPAKNLFRKPGETVNGNRYEGWWNSPRLEYAGQAGMFWMDLYGGGSGFYIASEDKTLTGGYLDANVNGGFLELGLGKYTDVKQNGSARYLFATGIHTGDWRRGADIYREWANSFMREPKVPAWAREMPGWLWHSSIWSMGPDKPKMKAGFDFGNVKSDMFDRAVSLGTGVIGLAGLEFMGHDYPLWEPDLLLGGDKAIIDAVKNVHRRGGRIVPYINPIYAWENYPGVAHCDDLQYRFRLKALNKDVLQPDWEYYRQFAALRYDGTWNNVETHYHGNLPQMCLATKEWQDYVLWWTKRYAEYYGFDGVQWDQLGAYQNTYCLDESHGHSVSGCATEGISELCKRIFSDPEYGVGDDFYIWYEGASDIYGQYLHAGHSGFDLWMAYGFPELIQYTFGKDLLGGEYNLMDGMQREGRVRAFRCVESSFLGRYKLGTGQNEEKALKLQKLTPLLNLLKGIYWYTEYKGRDACSAPEGVETSLLEVRRDICPYLDCGGYAVPVCDMRKNKTECEVSFEGDIPVTEALWFRAGANPRGVPVPFTAENGRITVTLPENDGQSAFDFRQAYCKDDKKVSSPGLLILTEKKTSPLLIELPLRAERGKSFTVR
ncbi:MAG: hypothetical protein ILO36_00845, partial [Abditibacteriota bacterium]|nr:hypothetical protein [Abditibacteriota bacterium]